MLISLMMFRNLIIFVFSLVLSEMLYSEERPKIDSVFGGNSDIEVRADNNSDNEGSYKSFTVFSNGSRPYVKEPEPKKYKTVQNSVPETKAQSVFNSKEDSKPATNPKTPFKFKMDAPKTVSNKPEMLWPVETGYVSSMFGWRTSSRFHDGIDIAAPIGTKVFAAEDGEVIYSDSKIHGYGNMIVVKHGNGIFSVYAHNKTNIVDKGDRVNRGQHIADVGRTGRAYGAHLHFEVREGKFAVDPLKYVTPPSNNRLARNN